MVPSLQVGSGVPSIEIWDGAAGHDPQKVFRVRTHIMLGSALVNSVGTIDSVRPIGRIGIGIGIGVGIGHVGASRKNTWRGIHNVLNVASSKPCAAAECALADKRSNKTGQHCTAGAGPLLLVRHAARMCARN